MSYASALFGVGIVVFSLGVLAPMRWVHDDRESFTRKRTRGGIALAFLFPSFTLLHFLVAKMEEPAPETRLQVFDC